MEGIIKAVCISEKRGTVKKNINEVKVIKDFGLEGDAHAGKWHRQVSFLSADIVDEFKCCNVYAKEKCRNCFAKFYCSGGCAANSYNCHGRIDDVYELGCELQKKRVECAIMIKAALADEEK